MQFGISILPLAACLALSLAGCGKPPAGNTAGGGAANTADGVEESPPAADPSTLAGKAPLTDIKLTAAVALAQTGVEGELMSFSVDYRFSKGDLNKESQYLWVVTPGQGPPLEQPVK